MYRELVGGELDMPVLQETLLVRSGQQGQEVRKGRNTRELTDTTIGDVEMLILLGRYIK